MQSYIPPQNAITAINYFMSQGMPYQIAVGMTANLMHESNLDPRAKSAEDDAGRYAYGIGQWRGMEEGGRQANMLAFSDSQGQDADPFMTQLKFMMQELNPDSQYYDELSGERYKHLLGLHQGGSLNTMPDITKQLENAFFRADGAGMGDRINYADKLSGLGAGWYKGMQGKNITPEDLLNNKRRGLSGGLIDMFTQPGRDADRTKFLGNLALALNSMRLKPDQGLAVAMNEQIKGANEEIAARKSLAGGGLTKEKFNMAGQLRDDLRTNLSEYSESRTAYNQLVSIFPENTPGGTFAFITAFVKTTDPGSVVKGEEMKAVQNSGALLPSWKQQILANMNVNNETAALPRTIREQMMTVAYKAMQSRTASAIATYNGALNVAQKQGIPAEYIWFGTPPSDAELPDFSVLDKNDPPTNTTEAPADTRTQTAKDLGVTAAQWNAMSPSEKILFKD
jgi:hypothetical protein